MKAKMLEIHAKDPHDIMELEGMSELEFHEKLFKDVDFLKRVCAFTVNMTEAEFEKKLPAPVRLELMKDLGLHGIHVYKRIKNPPWYGMKEFTGRADEVMAAPAKIIGYVSILTMVVFWATKFFGLVFTK